jgi:CRP-like cAMP-binding protein
MTGRPGARLWRLADLLRNDPDLQFVFLTKVTHELRKAQRRSIVLGRRDAVGRVAMFLMSLRQHLFGED